MSKYTDLKSENPIMVDCFFAFGNEQFEKAIEKHNLKGKKLYNGGHALYGTKEGIDNLMKFYDDLNDRIAEQCTPQEVYNYELSNHECSYTNDDEQAIKIVIGIFGEDKTKSEVKRRFAYYQF